MRGIKVALRTCLGVSSKDSVLIVYDKNYSELSGLWRKEAEQITPNVDSIETPIASVSGEEPSREVAEKMKKKNVVLLLTTMSLSHTRARKLASESGARIASMPGITEDIISRSLDVDYDQLKAVTAKLADALDRTEKVRITTELGTDLLFSVKDRSAHGREAGIYTKPGFWGNLPEGEVFVAPIEGTAEGRLVVDASMAGIGKLDEPIAVDIKDGSAVRIEGGKQAGDFQQMLESVGNKAFCVAEFGIGINDSAIVTGNVLEDEKAMDTAHIAFGNNVSFGGTNDVPIHLDGVFNKPNLFFDGKNIMKQGKFFI